MKTPIIDFINDYKGKKPLRLHTPGHKGFVFCGHEEDDITEIPGADELFSPDGIIELSQKNVSRLFGVPTYYSTEGSSLCVRAMVFLLCQRLGRQARILAARNVHRSFITAAALTGADVIWQRPLPSDTVVSVTVDPVKVEEQIIRDKPDAVYITTPDYLGKTADVAAVAAVCHRHGVYLLVDCAHGAYLHFLPEPSDPLILGADVCCTSAHKTLPALTGAAYLHTAEFSREEVLSAMAAFASTSPSYLILQSLDGLNRYLCTYRQRLRRFIPEVDNVKASLAAKGYVPYGDEPMKITLRTSMSGLTGYETQSRLIEKNIYPEYADRDFITFLPNPQTGVRGLRRLSSVLCGFELSDPLEQERFAAVLPRRAMSIRDAFFAKKTVLPVSQCEGRIAGDVCVSCPPAVSPVVCGEVIDGETAEYLRSHGVKSISVIT